MAQRIYCDCCGEEIIQNSLQGAMMRQRERYSIETIPGIPLTGFVKPPRFLSKSIQPEMWDLCERCQRWIWGIMETRQKNTIAQRTQIAIVPLLIKTTNHENNNPNYPQSSESST